MGKSAFYKRLRQAVTAAGITWKQLGERVGAAPATVSGWKNAKALPEGEYMLKLPDALGVSAEWLITGRGEMDPVDSTEAQTKMRLIRAILETPLTELAEDGRAWVEEELQHYDRQPPPAAPPRRAGGGGGPT